MDKSVQVAMICHAAHNEYAKQIGQPSISWEDKGEEHQQTVIDSVNKIMSGEIKSPEQAHNNFVKRKEADGWVYGLEFSTEKKINPRLIPFNRLSRIHQNKEELFFNIVKVFM